MLTEWQHSPAEWDKRAASAMDGGLLQSWAWGEFQRALGNQVFRLVDEQTGFIVQAQKLRAGPQNILVISRGPVGENWSDANIKEFTSSIKQFAAAQNCFLVRMDAPADEHQPFPGWKKAYDRQPRHTLIIDTRPSEDELLAAMKPKWRYNIKVAQKNQVTIRRSADPKDATAFAALMNQTTERQHFASYDAKYFATLLQTLGPANQAELLFAELSGKPIAGLLMCRFASAAYYLHGGSDYEHRAMMAPHLLQWEAIKIAKTNNQSYDFWGVASNPPANEQEKSWAGITRFKQGFAPKTTTTGYAGTYELPVKALTYALYSLRQLWKRRT